MDFESRIRVGMNASIDGCEGDMSARKRDIRRLADASAPERRKWLARAAQARQAHPDLTFLVGDIEDAAFVRSLPGPFDVIVVVDTLGALDDCQAMFANLHDLCTRETRVVVGYFSHLWYPALKLAEATGMKMP